MALTNKNYILD